MIDAADGAIEVKSPVEALRNEDGVFEVSSPYEPKHAKVPERILWRIRRINRDAA
jgi:hypothetical protein